MFKYIVSFLILFFSITSAQAKWFKASSEHFVIYSDQPAKQVKNFATRLEKYHSALEFVTGRRLGDISPSNRVTVFVVKDQRAIKKLYGDKKSNVAGFYNSRAGGSVAFVPRTRGNKGKDVSFSEIVLLHEYAHHFQLSQNASALPLWYTEGFAEFYASAAFDKDGSVWVGRAANHRAYELRGTVSKIPLLTLLDTEAYSKKRNLRKTDSFYGRSWLLFHYLTMSKISNDAKRSNDLGQYLMNLNEGKEALESATDAFGDFKDLEYDLQKYLKQRRILALRLTPDKISVKPITVSPLSAAADKMMPILMRSRRGVNKEQAAVLITEARELAVQFPNDEFTAAAMAEAEFDAGNDVEAITYADLALSFNPNNMDAHIQKIYATYRIADNSDDEAAAKANWKIVSRAISKANRAENDHPIPLIYYYRTFAAKGKNPNEISIRGLEQALGLAPYDINVRFMLINQYLFDHRFNDARRILRPLRSDPHNRGFGTAAVQMLEEIDLREKELEEQTKQDIEEET